MHPRKLTRVTRGHKLSKEESAKDRETRRRIREEFPPVREEPIPDSVSNALKTAIQNSGITVYEIAKRARVSQIILSRFLSGERDIRMATADKLARVLALRLVKK